MVDISSGTYADSMTSKYVWCGVLIIALSVALASPANARGEEKSTRTMNTPFAADV
jgi:hypothetical protein